MREKSKEVRHHLLVDSPSMQMGNERKRAFRIAKHTLCSKLKQGTTDKENH